MTRHISTTTRKALVEALRLRYRSAAFSDRTKILAEFVALTCHHRQQRGRQRTALRAAQAAGFFGLG